MTEKKKMKRNQINHKNEKKTQQKGQTRLQRK